MSLEPGASSTRTARGESSLHDAAASDLQGFLLLSQACYMCQKWSQTYSRVVDLDGNGKISMQAGM